MIYNGRTRQLVEYQHVIYSSIYMLVSYSYRGFRDRSLTELFKLSISFQLTKSFAKFLLSMLRDGIYTYYIYTCTIYSTTHSIATPDAYNAIVYIYINHKPYCIVYIDLYIERVYCTIYIERVYGFVYIRA